MDATERALFTDAIRRVTATATGDALDTALAELGWTDALREDQATAVAVLFEAQGRANTTSSGLDDVLSTALTPAALVPAAVVLPPLRSVEPPGRIDGGRIVVRGLGLSALACRADAVIVVAADGGREAMLVAPAASLTLQPISGLDAALGFVEVSGELERASLPDAVPVDWYAALAAGQLALGHEMVGLGRAMLELARLHALERMQFGQPISSFQAVRHRLAESLVALEAAAALLAAASDEPIPATASMAKAKAGRAARTAARHCQQVLAGIGFTTEHALHRFVRRTYVLDQLLGAGDALTRQLGAEVLATGSLPASFPL